MRILYGIQATGNGHISRAIELYPALSKIAEVDTLLSGTEGSLSLPFNIDFVRSGLSFSSTKNGGVSLLKSIKNASPKKLIFDIKNCPVKEYDLIISDFEPITAWSARIAGKKCINLSHQASFYYKEAPRPKVRSIVGEMILKKFAPSNINLGFHFKTYNKNIYEPIIRHSIRNLKPDKGDHNLVYLPAYCPFYIASVLSHIDEEQWKVFSPKVEVYNKIKNVHLFPVSGKKWLDALADAKSVLIGAGFEGPSEAIYLGKKLMVIPMKNQYEQICNAAALNELGVPSINLLCHDQIPNLRKWLNQEAKQLKINYENNTDTIVNRILSMAS